MTDAEASAMEMENSAEPLLVEGAALLAAPVQLLEATRSHASLEAPTCVTSGIVFFCVFAQFETAATHYSAALKASPRSATLEKATLLSNRSAAYASLCQAYRSRPASRSEASALFGLDPSYLAQLALKDATKAVEGRPDWAKAYSRQALALFLLEQYPAAESAYLEGLSLEPENNTLQGLGLRVVCTEAACPDALAGTRHAVAGTRHAVAGTRHAVAATQLAHGACLPTLLGSTIRPPPLSPCGKRGAASPTSTRAVFSSTSTDLLTAAEAALGCPAPPNPLHTSCPPAAPQNGLRELKAVMDAELSGLPAPKKQRVANAQASDDFECTLCLKLLFEPVTTPCGHTFCRGCFARAIDHSSKCPMCRTVLHIGRELPMTVTLSNILIKSFPEEYEERRLEAACEGAKRGGSGAGAEGAAAGGSSGPAGEEAEVSLPLFVMSTLMPGERMVLNIFEPRYRLMVRRNDRAVEDVATEVEILECNTLPDGWVESQVHSLVTHIRTTSAGHARGGAIRDLIERAGDKPPTGQHEALSFWVVSACVLARSRHAPRRSDAPSSSSRAESLPPVLVPSWAALRLWALRRLVHANALQWGCHASCMINFLHEFDGEERMRLLRFTSTEARLGVLREVLERHGLGEGGGREVGAGSGGRQCSIM
ncbi:MAG: hypothetical protein WDW38_008217 [Sanguina aurantia]